MSNGDLTASKKTLIDFFKYEKISRVALIRAGAFIRTNTVSVVLIRNAVIFEG